ncbi:MAG: Rne/Rng family ribonuclease [Acidobacteria bacterium]|nr:Rne/Rng family ribonuclease [Acidobacteriota bacterium]
MARRAALNRWRRESLRSRHAGRLHEPRNERKEHLVSEETPRPQIGDTRPAPQIGDTRPAPQVGDTRPAPSNGGSNPSSNANRNRRRKKRGPGNGQSGTSAPNTARSTDAPVEASAPEAGEGGSKRNRRRSRGGDRRSKAQGRYAMYVHGSHGSTHIATMEGRSLVEFRVARAADETNQIDGNIYVGRVQNVLPGMELAFVDIGIPKNAVLYRSDVAFDSDEVESSPKNDKRIEEMLKGGQTIVCQVTKNAIGAKGARLTQDVSLPGRFAVLVPNSQTIGISKRLGDGERKRLKKVIDEVRPPQHGIIVRTAAEGVSADDLARDVRSLADKWAAIEAEVAKSPQPRLIYRDLDLAVRMLREELNDDYRSVLIDDKVLFDKVREYVLAVNPELADRVEYYDASTEGLPLFERYFVQEQLQRALDRKVWLPSGGSLIIERTEALTVIDVNTGKNVGSTNLEETVFRNNLEAAEEVARQLRLRDIGGIIVIDFIDMESKSNRDAVASALRQALQRDKTRTQVFDISELGLVEMTRKRVNEGLLESVSSNCETCDGRGFVLEAGLSWTPRA